MGTAVRLTNIRDNEMEQAKGFFLRFSGEKILEEAQENVLDVSRQEEVNIAKARTAIKDTNELKEAKAQKRQTSENALRIAFQAQVSGSGSVLGVMEAKADLAMTEDELNEAQAASEMAQIDLLHAEGRLRELVKKGE